jgi:hypothetical protein
MNKEFPIYRKMHPKNQKQIYLIKIKQNPKQILFETNFSTKSAQKRICTFGLRPAPARSRPAPIDRSHSHFWRSPGAWRHTAASFSSFLIFLFLSFQGNIQH